MIECHDLSYGERLTGKQLFLNTNGVLQLESKNATSGGVLRDENGGWISGYNRYLGNLEVVKAIQVSISTTSNSALIR
ncbi:hypothetical protein Gotur_015800 [Gossypium turneri]